jgi:hypothetical protein
MIVDGSQPRQQWKENWKLIVRWQQSYQSLWITTRTTMKGELKTDSQMSTIIPVTVVIWLSVFDSPFIVVVVVIHSDWYDCCHLTISFRFSFQVTMDHNHDNNERRTENWSSDDNNHTSHYGSQPRQQWKENWKLIYQFSVLLSLLSWLWSIVTGMIVVIWLSVFSSPFIVVVVVIHSDWYDCCHHHNNERRTENW